MLRQFHLFALTLLVLPGVAARGLEVQVEQARQFEQVGTVPESSVAPAAPTPLEPSSSRDMDSFGVQQLLRDREPPLRPFRVYSDISALLTSNVALTRRSPQQDGFLLATLGMEYRQPLANGLSFDAEVKISTFRYSRFTTLSFDSVDAGFGLGYHSALLGGIDFFGRYNFTDLIGDQSRESFFQNHTVCLGLQKPFVFNPAHYAFVGLSAQLGLADPKISQRAEYSAFAGYHLRATRHLEIDLLYRFALYQYSQDGRLDENQTLSLGLRYRVNDWLSASSSAFLGYNRSNQTVFDYQVGNVGIGLTLTVQF